MSWKSKWVKVTPLPEDKEVGKVLNFSEKNSESVSGKLVGALMVVQDWGMELETRQEFVVEYNKVLTLMLAQNREQQDEMRSYQTLEKYILSTLEVYPTEDVFEFEINSSTFRSSVYMKYNADNDVLMFSIKLRFTKRLEKLFEGNLPEHIQRDLEQMPSSATEIWLTSMYIVIPEWWNIGMETVFDITYTWEDSNDWNLEIAHTFTDEQDWYNFLVRNTDEKTSFEEILIYNDDYLDEFEMDHILKDVEILYKLEEYDRELFLVVSAYHDNSLDESARKSILDTINNYPERKEKLRNYSTEWSIWRLRYLLKNSQNNYFYLWLRDFSWWSPASMMSFPAYTEEMKKVVAKASYITAWKIWEDFSWRKRINLSISWEIVGDNEVALSVVFVWKKWKENVDYTYETVVVAEQLLDLISLVTPTSFPLASVICRDDIDNDDYEDA